jgi:hypothetical protein
MSHARYGDEIGRLTLASDYVKEALSVSRKGIDASVLDDLKVFFSFSFWSSRRMLQFTI